jgi:phosphoglycerate dehydrogenase-like enzyme
MKKKIRTVIAVRKFMQAHLFKPELLTRLSAVADVARYKKEDMSTMDLLELLRANRAEACITGWGTPQLDKDVIAGAPDLKIICHAAGSVKCIVSDAVWDKKIVVTSASAGIAVDVAETTLGLMIISIKRIWQYSRNTREGKWGEGVTPVTREMGGKNIGIIGASHIGRNLIRLLKNFEVKIFLYDPYVTRAEAVKLGVTKVTLDELMKKSDIVTVHAPNVEATYHMINKNNLKLMRDGGILINTARGRLIDEPALIEELKTGRIFACLDVTDPEPPPVDSEFRKLPNVILTPHIAGCITDTVTRLAELAVEEVIRFVSGKPNLYPVTKKMLSKVA